jgi:hypothetical protein
VNTEVRDEKRAVTLVACGQVCFIVFIGVCVALRPGFVLKGNEGGISDYGSHIQTAIVYSIALGGLAELCRRAGAFLHGNQPATRRLRRILNFYFANVLVMLLTSYVYSINIALRDLHFACGTVLILFEVAASWWMFRITRRVMWDGVFLLTQWAGSVLCLVTIAGAMHILFIGEMVTWAGFAGLLIHATRVVVVASQDSPNRVTSADASSAT